MAIIRIGVDLAKNVFALHGVDESGKVQMARMVRREQLLDVLAAVPPCVIAMEACSGAHELARRVAALGHARASWPPSWRGYMRALVAIANKNARLAWAVLRRGEDFRMHEIATT
jgi:hypothetical protein